MAPGEVRDTVAQQIEGLIYSLFAWQKGEYCFEKQTKPVGEDMMMNLLTVPIILGGIRRMDDSGAIRRAKRTWEWRRITCTRRRR